MKIIGNSTFSSHKVLLGHSHADLFDMVYCCVYGTMVKWSICDRKLGAHGVQNVYCLSLYMKVGCPHSEFLHKHPHDLVCLPFSHGNKAFVSCKALSPEFLPD